MMLFYFCVLIFSVIGTEACPAGWTGIEGGELCYLGQSAPDREKCVRIILIPSLVSGSRMSWYAAEEVNTPD